MAISGYVKDLASQALRNKFRPLVYKMQRDLVSAERLLLRKEGSLPSFLVLGAQKAGTTSLFDMISGSPTVSPPRTKEIGFFDRYYDLGMDWYRANFPSGAACTGEATPDYLYLDEARQRIANDLPRSTKFIILLRQPTKRLISHYFHARRIGYEQLPIEKALALEAERIGRLGNELAGNPLEERSFRSAYSYFDRGLYAEQISKWFENFPRENFFIETTEELIKDSDAVYRNVCRHLGIEKSPRVAAPQKNKGVYSTEIDKAIIRQIDQRYEASIIELESLIGKKTGWL
jgi:hypothetical protein